LGREVRLLWSQDQRTAQALDIDDQFGLVVRYGDGAVETVRTGEASVRGLGGYT
jgi:BirA family biotin operon repressor/biotin-[acetyl-CoA-carboxylase] ligase